MGEGDSRELQRVNLVKMYHSKERPVPVTTVNKEAKTL